MMDWRNCKYILPCGNCDKYDCFCKAAECEMSEGKKNPSEECTHNWILEKIESVEKETSGTATYYTQKCSICGASQIKKIEYDENHKYNVTIWRGV